MVTQPHEVHVGAAAPDFALDGTGGRTQLAAYRQHQHVILYFMREFTCPVCQHHVARLGRIYAQLQQQHTTVLVIGGGDRSEAEALQQRFKLPFPVLADPDRRVYRQYGLDKALTVMQRGGSFLVDTTGIVRYALRSTLPTGALNETLLLRAIDAAEASPVQHKPGAVSGRQLEAR